MEKLLIEKYFEKGWLKFGNPQISADIKLMVGLRFYGDYLEAENKHSLGVQNYILERIDGGEKVAFQEKHLLKSGRFIKVLKKIPPEYKSVLIETVLENKERRFLKETYVNGTSGYRIWSDGYCEQWGVSGSGTVTVNILKTYSNANYHVQVTSIRENTSSDATNAKILTVNSFKIWQSGSTTGAYWKASGYLAEGEY